MDKDIAKLFVEWVSEEHYRLWNIEDNVCYWKNGEGIHTTDELYEIFKYELNTDEKTN